MPAYNKNHYPFGVVFLWACVCIGPDVILPVCASGLFFGSFSKGGLGWDFLLIIC